jgi:putative spermidine/putrescine transport system substrate-binding protein
VDPFGYNTDIIKLGIPYPSQNRGWLIDAKDKAKVSIINDLIIGFFYLALAAKGMD